MAADDQSAGAPAWVMTFADLMSLLLAFFVLLFSFSELDKQMYKQVAGSMRNAFGIQRTVRAKEPPKGMNIIAREYSPGKPKPTTMNEVRQFTTKDSLKYPNLGGPLSTRDRDKSKKVGKDNDQKRIQLALKEEIEKGLIELVITDRKIIVRIKEKGSFPSGSERLKEPFVPTIQRLAQTLTETRGQLVISGHTDSVPIENSRFRSNWELSAARSASVAHVFLSEGLISNERVHLEAYADTQPIDTNDSPEGRAKNRRVDLALVYGEDTIREQDKKSGNGLSPQEGPIQEDADQ